LARLEEAGVQEIIFQAPKFEKCTMCTHAEGMADWGRTGPSREYSVQDGENSVLSKVEM
jgi:hypothetical protein